MIQSTSTAGPGFERRPPHHTGDVVKALPMVPATRSNNVAIDGQHRALAYVEVLADEQKRQTRWLSWPVPCGWFF